MEIRGHVLQFFNNQLLYMTTNNKHLLCHLRKFNIKCDQLLLQIFLSYAYEISLHYMHIIHAVLQHYVIWCTERLN